MSANHLTQETFFLPCRCSKQAFPPGASHKAECQGGEDDRKRDTHCGGGQCGAGQLSAKRSDHGDNCGLISTQLGPPLSHTSVTINQDLALTEHLLGDTAVL